LGTRGIGREGGRDGKPWVSPSGDPGALGCLSRFHPGFPILDLDSQSWTWTPNPGPGLPILDRAPRIPDPGSGTQPGCSEPRQKLRRVPWGALIGVLKTHGKWGWWNRNGAGGTETAQPVPCPRFAGRRGKGWAGVPGPVSLSHGLPSLSPFLPPLCSASLSVLGGRFRLRGGAGSGLRDVFLGRNRDSGSPVQRGLVCRCFLYGPCRGRKNLPLEISWHSSRTTC
jgi:hypothetical protein